MGYNSNPALIEQNLPLVQQISEKISRGETITLRVDPGENIQTEQYRLRRLLAACDAFRTAYAGKFAGLGALCSIKIDHEKQTLIIRPKGGVSVKRFRATERDAIDFLIEQKGSMTMVEFWPSEVFREDAFLRDALAVGWSIIPGTKIDENGKLGYGAEKVEINEEPKTGFAALGGG